MADETPGDPGATGAAAGGTAQPFKVFATEAEFNAHAAKIRHEAERKARNSVGDTAELDTVRTELEQLRQAELERKGKYEEAKTTLQKAADDRVTKEQAARQKAEAALHRLIVEDQLTALAKAHGAYSAEDVVLRLKDRILLDGEYQVRVSDAPGGTVQDGLTMEQAVIELLKANPHLAKATGAGQSAGAQGGKAISGSFSGTPSQREAQAKVEAAKAAVKANPLDSRAAVALLNAERALRTALAG